MSTIGYRFTEDGTYTDLGSVCLGIEKDQNVLQINVSWKIRMLPQLIEYMDLYAPEWTSWMGPTKVEFAENGFASIRIHHPGAVRYLLFIHYENGDTTHHHVHFDR